MGLTAAIVVALLVVSGIALNHTDRLKLDATPVHNRWVLKWYGLETVAPTRGIALSGGYLVWDTQKWAIGNKLLAEREPAPIGAVEVGRLLYVATRSTLLVFDRGGALVDKIDRQGLPAVPLERLGAAGSEAVIATPAGEFASEDGLNWRRAAAASANWSQMVALPGETAREAAEVFAASIPLERVLLDLHSGRAFGRYGPWLVDAVAVGLAFLAGSGVWVYSKAWRRRRRVKSHIRDSSASLK